MRRRAFVCPSCGYLDEKGEMIVEVWKEVKTYLYNPESLDCERDDEGEVCLEFDAVECRNCGWRTGLNEFTSDPAISNLLVEVEEDEDTITLYPVGDYWKKKPSKLGEVVEKYLNLLRTTVLR